MSPTTLLLLCHFTNSISSTESQISKTLINIYERMHSSAHLLTTTMLLNGIAKMHNHSLTNFKEIANDQKLAERQSFVFN